MKLILKDYDEYLLTLKNMQRFVDSLKEVNVDVGIAVQPYGLELDFGAQKVPEHVLDCCEDFWEADPRLSEIDPDYEAVALALYEILDDIDTISDIARDNDKLYRQLVQHRLDDRFKFCKSDGYTVSFTTPSSTYTMVEE